MTRYQAELYHYGVKGMKWGVRRFQNPDGSLTEAGRTRYARPTTVFVSGSSKTQDGHSGYFRGELPAEVTQQIDEYLDRGYRFVVGDAPGIDRQVQDHLRDKGAKGVTVYGPGKSVRYTADPTWHTRAIDAPEYPEDSSEWLAKKDIAMTKAADIGLAVILDEGAKATRRNVERLLSHDKAVRVYELDKRGPEYDRWKDKVDNLLDEMSEQS